MPHTVIMRKAGSCASSGPGHLTALRELIRQIAPAAAAQLLGVVGGAIDVQDDFTAGAQAVEVRRALQLRRIVAGNRDADGGGHADIVRFCVWSVEGFISIRNGSLFSARVGALRPHGATRALNEDGYARSP